MFLVRPLTTRGWAQFNGVHWRRDYPEFVEWFAARCTSEAHSTKGFDDMVGWLPLFYPKINLLVRPRVEGISVTPNGLVVLDWTKVRLK